jgi:hypothetical protein
MITLASAPKGVGVAHSSIGVLLGDKGLDLLSGMRFVFAERPTKLVKQLHRDVFDPFA